MTHDTAVDLQKMIAVGKWTGKPGQEKQEQRTFLTTKINREAEGSGRTAVRALEQGACLSLGSKL